MTEKDKKDAAFIEKIKSLNIGTGLKAKSKQPGSDAKVPGQTIDVECPFCEAGHKVKAVYLGTIPLPDSLPPRNTEKPKSSETAFAA